MSSIRLASALAIGQSTSQRPSINTSHHATVLAGLAPSFSDPLGHYMDAIQTYVAAKSVVVLNAGNVRVMPTILARAGRVHVVDSKGQQWAAPNASFERGNPLTYSVSAPFDVVWSNIDVTEMDIDDVRQLVSAVAKLARDAIFAVTSGHGVALLEQVVQSKHVDVDANVAVVSKVSFALADSSEESVVAVWSDRKMPLIWRDSVYTGKCAIMTELYTAQKAYIASLMALDRPTSYVEVGCGTSEMGSVLFERMAYTVGVEINPVMIELAKDIHPAMHAHPRNYLIEGNALELEAILKRTMPADFWTSTRVVAILMNTFGILPEAIRQGVIDQMIDVAGDDGVVVIGCWHSESFRRGVHEYYMKNPALVGDNVTLDMCDFTTSDLWVPSSKYESHWFSAAELKRFVQAHAANGYAVSTHVEGIGIFLTCRRQRRADAASTL
ncbi:hypothetical protein H310_01894 [Aphanomyces invadans]|uniref:Methyltransferase domain-containing protein n=1 Tax=Aphanomyces invadans TaxID=157072 RepID=A0A024UP09_9STRA|nr:hypothetical protein H310_01894 [Aphanomyces invadans]ETW07358.1 hypothetical protein H310_01894 [Aphanomyces invadans]|eukprot:XP_008863451.1 hypothetical protein H310_01894 [Aphanomyces invadans]